jgi:hypothetical protein
MQRATLALALWLLFPFRLCLCPPVRVWLGIRSLVAIFRNRGKLDPSNPGICTNSLFKVILARPIFFRHVIRVWANKDFKIASSIIRRIDSIDNTPESSSRYAGPPDELDGRPTLELDPDLVTI